MKLLICLVGIAIIVFTLYSVLSHHPQKGKKSQQKKSSRNMIGITVVVAILLLGCLACIMYKSAGAPDTQCSKYHAAKTQPPKILVTAKDYFELANYDYDSGNCKLAITHYSKAISLNPNYPQAYNNRAYTYMRMRQYDKALPDLDEAISLHPTYVQALMNRGDIHNYYYAIDRDGAIIDYQKVISFDGAKETNVCGHLFLARHNGWNMWTVLSLPWELLIKRMCR